MLEDMRMPAKGQQYLPILSISLKHHGIFRLADFARIFVFGFFDISGCLNAFILRKSAMMSFLQKGISLKYAKYLD